MTYYAIIDTNVIISALRSNTGNAYKLFEYFNDKIKIIYNNAILNEYIEIANREEHKKFINQNAFDNFINTLVNTGLKLETNKEIKEFLDKWTTNEDKEKLSIDKDDVIFYEIAFYGNNKVSTNTKLITYNKKHFPIKPFIVDPKEMLNIIKIDEQREKEYKKRLKKKSTKLY